MLYYLYISKLYKFSALERFTRPCLTRWSLEELFCGAQWQKSNLGKKISYFFANIKRMKDEREQCQSSPPPPPPNSSSRSFTAISDNNRPSSSPFFCCLNGR